MVVLQELVITMLCQCNASGKDYQSEATKEQVQLVATSLNHVALSYKPCQIF